MTKFGHSCRSLTCSQRHYCSSRALEDVGLSAAEPVQQLLLGYFTWATTTTMSRYHESAADVPDALSIPRWSWDGLQR